MFTRSSSRLNITNNQEELQDFIENLTSDTAFINRTNAFAAACLNDIPEELMDDQEPIFIYLCLKKRVASECKLRRKLAKFGRVASALPMPPMTTMGGMGITPP